MRKAWQPDDGDIEVPVHIGDRCRESSTNCDYRGQDRDRIWNVVPASGRLLANRQWSGTIVGGYRFGSQSLLPRGALAPYVTTEALGTETEDVDKDQERE